MDEKDMSSKEASDHGDSSNVEEMHEKDMSSKEAASDHGDSSNLDLERGKPHHEDEASEHTKTETLHRTATAATSKSSHSITRALSRGIAAKPSNHSITRALSRVITGPPARPVHHAPLPQMDLDAGIVGWEGQDDPANPLNFSPKRKNVLVGLLAAITLLSPFTSSILSPGIVPMMADLGITNEIAGSMAVSVYVLGYVVGPLFLAPLCEIYGRAPVLRYSNIFFCLWQIGCALAPNIASLIVFRFLAGLGGAGCLSLGGGVISDLFPPAGRGFAMGLWSLGPLFGPTVGPIIGGFVAETIGWRWDFWIVLICAVLVTTMIEVFNQETSHRILIKKKVARLQKETGRTDLKSCYEVDGPVQSKLQVLSHGLVRPLKMLFLSPLVFSLSLYVAFVYGCLYLLFTTMTAVFEGNYGFSSGLAGLVYISLGLGCAFGWLYISLFSDKSVVKLTAANGGVFEPEMRLSIFIWFGLFVPITFFWYGWSAFYQVHWIVPTLGLLPFGIGCTGIMQVVLTYLVDCYPLYASSAIAANTVLRSLFGAILPLAGSPLYARLGLGWGSSLLGFIAVGMIPIPLLFYKFGGRLRKAEKLQL